MTTTELPPAASSAATTASRPAPRPEGTTPPPPIQRPTPIAMAVVGAKHGSSQEQGDTHAVPAAAAQPDDGHSCRDTQTGTAVVAPVSPAGTGHASIAEATVQPPTLAGDTQALLVLAAQTLTDLEATRMANANRLRALRDVYGLTGSPQEAEAAGLVDGIHALEKQAEKTLRRALRAHPLGAWVTRTAGVGEKRGARLLAVIGDPYIRPELTRPDGTVEPTRPRTVSELWAYCGLHVVNGAAPTRTRGQRANWNAEARSRLWLIAGDCVIQKTSPYRPVYDAARAKYADAVHAEPCKRCGPTGRPAPAGSPLSAGHQHNRALRLISKRVLADLWAESKSQHDSGAARHP